MVEKRRMGRIALLVLLSLALMLLLIMGLGYGILRSPAMQQRILTSIQTPLAKLGVELKIGSLSIDLLAGINLQRLDLTVNRPPELKAKLNIAHLRLGYSWLGLLQQRLQLDEVFIEGLQGELNLTLPAAAPTPEPAPTGLGPLLDLIRQPPLELAIDSIVLRETRLKLHLVQGLRTVEAEIDQADLRSDIALHRGLLELSSKFDLKLKLSLEQTDAEKNTLQLQSNLEFRPDLKLAVQLTGDHMQWHVAINQAPLI